MNAAGLLDAPTHMAQDQQRELVAKQIAITNLRSRLSKQPDKEEQLREACEGFESLFIQKLWEQMRKNLPKEGYLHSKEEEAYQSLFDVEFAKKMASAGGIGLADMLFEQLSKNITERARSTTPGTLSALHTPTSDGAPQQTALPEQQKPAAHSDPFPGNLTPEHLYSGYEPGETLSEIDQTFPHVQNEQLVQETTPDPSELAQPGQALTGLPGPDGTHSHIIAQAVHELREQTKEALFATETEQAAAASKQTGKAADLAAQTASAKQMSAQTQFGENNALSPASENKHVQTERLKGVALKENSTGTQQNPDGPSKTQEKTGQAPKASKPLKHAAFQTPPKGLLPQGAVWPHHGELLQRFGWQEDSFGARRWNAGITLSAQSGEQVSACLPGKIAYIGAREQFGPTVVLEHADGFVSFYGNVDAEPLQLGDTVKLGTNFARVLPNPNPTAFEENFSLFHFEIKRGEMALNPETVFKQHIATESARTNIPGQAKLTL